MGLAIIVPNVSFGDANLGKVTLSGNVPIRGLYIDLGDSYTGTTVDLVASFMPANTTQRNVVWSIESGSEYASISGSLLTILDGADGDDVTIKCVSVNNSAVYATKTISVTYQSSGTLVIYEGSSIVTDGVAFINALENFTGEKRFNLSASVFELDILCTNEVSAVRCPMGVFGGGPGAQFGVFIRDSSYHSVVRIPPADFESSIVSKRILVKNVNGTCTITYNGNIIETKNIIQEATAVGDVYLGCRNDNSTNTDLYATNIQIYGFKLSTTASGEICDLVPCKYEGVVGMYNKTDHKVLLPQSGTFTLV